MRVSASRTCVPLYNPVHIFVFLMRDGSEFGRSRSYHKNLGEFPGSSCRFIESTGIRQLSLQGVGVYGCGDRKGKSNNVQSKGKDRPLSRNSSREMTSGLLTNTGKTRDNQNAPPPKTYPKNRIRPSLYTQDSEWTMTSQSLEGRIGLWKGHLRCSTLDGAM